MNDQSETSDVAENHSAGHDPPETPPTHRSPKDSALSSSHLGKTGCEDEAGHLRRVADELGGANSGSLEILSSGLHGEGTVAERSAAAAALGTISDRHAIATLRDLLEQDDPIGWEIAVHGLRQSRDRSGWMCLESVALDHVSTLEDVAGETVSDPLHAFRLLVMGRTKTMDRLFRAIDGHSRSLSSVAALTFTRVAVRSVPSQMSTVMALRLGISDIAGGRPATPEQVSLAASISVETVRQLEGLAWETVQRSRRYADIRRNYEVNSDRFRPPD
jgi:hypothetical protein